MAEKVNSDKVLRRVWKLIMKTLTKIGVRKTWRGSSHALPLVLNYRPQQEVTSSEGSDITLLPWQEGGRFSSHLATSPANGKHQSSANEEPPLPWTLPSFQWTFTFLLLIVPCPTFLSTNSLSFCITLQSLSPLARWDAESFNKAILDLQVYSVEFFFFNKGN